MRPTPPATAGVFFDLYGTLLLYGDMDQAWVDWLAALDDAFRGAGLEISGEELGRACEGLFSGPAPSMDALGARTTKAHTYTLYERRLLGLGNRLGLDLAEAALGRAVQGTIAAWQRQVTLDPEAPGLLTRLGDGDRYGLALVTNFDHPPHVRRLLEELDLARYFDAIVISGEVGVTKPDPAIFVPALEATGLEARTVAYVGDAPEDVEAASAAGMRPVAIRREGAVEAAVVNDYGPDEAREREPAALPDDVVVIRHLSEVVAAVRPSAP